VAPPTADFRFRSVLSKWESDSNSKTVRARRENSTQHQKQAGVGQSNGQVTPETRSHLAAIYNSGSFSRLQNALNNSRTVRGKRRMSTENQRIIEIDLQNGQITSALRRHLAAIFASGPFSRLQQAVIT
jgi:hypothetical protein